MNTYMKFARHKNPPYLSEPAGSFKRTISFGYWTPYLPEITETLKDFGIMNPIKDVVHENVISVDVGDLRGYLHRHYYDSVRVDTVNRIGDVVFYKYSIVGKTMKSLLYLLVATALVTIAPFLITFEKGQDIKRGLLEYGIFALLLIYVSLKKYFHFYKKWILIAAVYAILVILSWMDLQTILAVKKWSVGWYGVIPFAACALALVLLKDVKGFSFRQVNIILFVGFFAHFGAMKFYSEQPLFQFSIPLYLTQQKQPVDRSYLPKEFRIRYNATDSVTVTKYYADSARSNVVVLVESWGIPMDTTKLNAELDVFNGLLMRQGVHFRMYSRTRTAEREDLLDSIRRDSTGRRDSLFMPKRFAELGYRTIFLFGGDSTIQWRYKYIRNIGFQNALWTDSATSDGVIAAKIDSLLNLKCDSLENCQNLQFIAWTTRDTRFPISDDAAEAEKLYFERLFRTLRIIADLAKKHPDVRFVVQGDHEPILAPLEFQAKFYRRWVPFVILN